LSPALSADDLVDDLLERISRQQTEQGARKRFELENVRPAYAIPSRWRWMRLADVGRDLGQTTPKGKFTYIDVSSIDNRIGVINDSPQVLNGANAPSRARKVVRRGSVIYSTVRPYLLNIALIDRDFDPPPIASTAFAVVHPFDGVEASYLYHHLRSPAFVRYVESSQSGIAYPAINDKKFFSGLIPLPPHAEQKRIVERVDMLMA